MSENWQLGYSRLHISMTRQIINQGLEYFTQMEIAALVPCARTLLYFWNLLAAKLPELLLVPEAPHKPKGAANPKHPMLEAL